MLTLEEGILAVKLARNTVLEHITKDTKPELTGFSDVFSEKRGVFVTLRKKGELRGCIGYPTPEFTLKAAITDSAMNAATKDPRFNPVKEIELKEITVEVTVLTPPELIESKPKDLPKNIEIGRHGLIVKKGFRQGLLLPQVATEHDMDEEDFLTHTCMKAGLHPDCWLDEDAEVMKFEGQIFEEVEPDGKIVELKLK